MLEAKKRFVQDQLNIERLTPMQWDGIMRAMDAYAQHYYEECLKNLTTPKDEKGNKKPCSTFLSDGTTTSATKCRFCGKEKWEHG